MKTKSRTNFYTTNEAGSVAMMNKKKGFKNLLKNIWKHRVLYLMFLPCVVYYILFNYIPMTGIVLAFKKYSFMKGIWGSDWVGLQYFKTFFTSYDCVKLLRNTLTVGLMKCILEFPFAIIFALLLNELCNAKFKKISQTISYP